MFRLRAVRMWRNLDTARRMYSQIVEEQRSASKKTSKILNLLRNTFEKGNSMFYIGCPMWGYKEWVGSGKLFPPRTSASDFLRLYSKKLTTVEGNTIFYALPSAETIARWVQDKIGRASCRERV